MGVSENFSTFISNLAVSSARRSTIAERREAVIRRINLTFWGSELGTDHSFYVGSFGRGTATGQTSDVDLLAELPAPIYHQYNRYSNNGQSALLQSVRDTIRVRYPSSEVGGDGQVVVIAFTDGITFEVLPAFFCEDGTYLNPDTNGGGSWKRTDPKSEINAINNLDGKCNGNLKNLCKMARAWKARCNVPISGWLIDTLAYGFMQNYEFKDQSFLFYDWISRDYFSYLSQQNPNQSYWYAPGSGQQVPRYGSFEYKAKQAYNKAEEAIADEGNGYTYIARDEWREIYGTAFPG